MVAGISDKPSLLIYQLTLIIVVFILPFPYTLGNNFVYDDKFTVIVLLGKNLFFYKFFTTPLSRPYHGRERGVVLFGCGCAALCMLFMYVNLPLRLQEIPQVFCSAADAEVCEWQPFQFGVFVPVLC